LVYPADVCKPSEQVFLTGSNMQLQQSFVESASTIDHRWDTRERDSLKKKRKLIILIRKNMFSFYGWWVKFIGDAIKICNGDFNCVCKFETMCDMIEKFIKQELKKSKREKVVIGLSGGLDSSVTACLAVQALSNKEVLSLILPDLPITPNSDVNDAIELARSLHIEFKIMNINDIKSEFLVNLPRNQYAEGNLTARIRMCILYYYSFIQNGLVLGTSDKSELVLGYYTKFGDGGADLFPLGDL
jgi:hypothetical protein